MRRSIFRFFAGVFALTLIVTIVVFDELSYVGVKIQYFLFIVMAISLPMSVLSYKKNSGYLEFNKE
ncbi:hypothetical protein GCM10009110_01760 [Psychrobacter piscatorii]